ncbi:PBP1A family penicillin-binding protein [Jeotgalibacillus sp. ET6]|uniref:PBP1A family penicillin-binding protein n=1 Tax=Jeotgalibacillus sp. ET6 TaxID=3037260 RepID=UPI00241814E3|nr:PBP1A family penicillin-binding protein [Jeotgalibacillus sp. ET6]MDG5470611.1 PBP1A family penicillin-binding protein [Jeotgalibacillus sp. ET6]
MADYSSREEKRKAQKASAKNKKTKKGKKSIFKRILLTVFLIGLAGLIGGGALFAYYAATAPELNEEDFIDPVTTEILDMDKNVIGRIGAENRELVAYDDIPPLVENAVLSIEDVRFYDHMGVDAIRLAGAVLANITEGFGAEGASTLTQQVIKQSVLTPEKSLERKAQEAWLAFQLEQKYSKEEIFEMYVNKIYYSDLVYGIRTASDYYYNAELDELELHQAALLAGIPQRPNAYNPYTNPDLAKERRDIVLRQMHNHGKISEEDMQQALNEDIMDGIVERTEDERKKLAGTDSGNDAFIDAVIDEVEAEGDFNPFEDGLKIYTTLDPEAQSQVENVLNNDVINFPDDMNGERSQAGITVLDTKTGAVRAIGGGRNFGQEVQRGYNYAVDNVQEVGSTIKPLLDYAPAIEQLEWSTAQIIVDEPTTFSEGYEPGNYDGQFSGPITMREALYDSRNITAIKAYNEAGPKFATDFLSSMGFSFDPNCGDVLCESAAIGSGTGTNTLNMAGAYAAFGNNGVYNEPHLVTSIEFRDGSSIDLEPESDVVMKDSTAYMITDMLKDVLEPYGTGPLAKVPGLPLAGKSGTTNYPENTRNEYNIPPEGSPDSWFAGYSTQYTTAVWLGYPTNTNYLLPQERQASQEIFKAVMQSVHEGVDTPDFPKPDTVVEVEIEKGTNPPQLASEYTPNNQKTTELFIRGTEPTAVSEEFVVPDLESPANLQADYDEEAGTIQLSWNHSQDEDDDRAVEFEVSYSINGGESQILTTTGDTALTVQQVEPGSSYTFSVIAIADSQRSGEATVSIDIGQREEDEEEPEEEIEEEPEDQETPPEETEEEQPEDSGDEENNEENQDEGTEQEDGQENEEDGVTEEEPGETDEDTPPDEQTPDDSAQDEEDQSNQNNTENTPE